MVQNTNLPLPNYCPTCRQYTNGEYKNCSYDCGTKLCSICKRSFFVVSRGDLFPGHNPHCPYSRGVSMSRTRYIHHPKEKTIFDESHVMPHPVNSNEAHSPADKFYSSLDKQRQITLLSSTNPTAIPQHFTSYTTDSYKQPSTPASYYQTQESSYPDEENFPSEENSNISEEDFVHPYMRFQKTVRLRK